MKKLLASLLLSILPLAAASAASGSPLQIGVLGEKCQLVSPDTPVIGLRLNLPFSFNYPTAGLDLGFASYAEIFSGIRLGALSVSDTLNGVSLGLLDGTDTLNGLQIAPVAIALDARGAQIGLFNWSDGLLGLQIGIVNNGPCLGSHSTVHGLQIGFLNVTGTLRGLQIGMANIVNNDSRGVQIGLINLDHSSDFPFLPLLRVAL